ncbi:hypothetical protein E3N88_09481 [Mikania micrantha]|uniref:Uncharacterized protein n=1 Tax=Mikania micrantha TaxID=192012 RepID=A0A5N6PM91_9ASTR|nr:hypothetical protein E3N88_09481 [Mikania micrantha]
MEIATGCPTVVASGVQLVKAVVVEGDAVNDEFAMDVDAKAKEDGIVLAFTGVLQITHVVVASQTRRALVAEARWQDYNMKLHQQKAQEWWRIEENRPRKDVGCLFSRRHFIKKRLRDLFLEKRGTIIFKPLPSSHPFFLPDRRPEANPSRPPSSSTALHRYPPSNTRSEP